MPAHIFVVMDNLGLYIARGSANETIDWYEKLKGLGYIKREKFDEREQMCQEIRAMLSKMIGTIERG